MPLGLGFRRYAALIEGDVARMRERQAVRTAGCDDVRVGEENGAVVITYARGHQHLWAVQAERLATFTEELSLLRWWWQGAPPGGTKRARVDAAYAEAQQLGIEELTTGTISVDDLPEAEAVCGVAASMARADGLECVREGDRWAFYALFEDTAAKLQLTVPPPRPTERPASASPVARRAVQSIPPPSDSSSALIPLPPGVPRTEPIQPGREAFTPVAMEAANVVMRAIESYGQALLTVTVDHQQGKTRFFVHVAATDANGDLLSLDPSQKLCDAVGTMIEDQRRAGGGGWRKLVARLKPSERGALVDVKVT